MKIAEVKDLNGDAQIVITRGKRKHVCDITFTIVWKLLIEHDVPEPNNLQQIDGNLTIQDFSADGDYETLWAVSTKIDQKDNNLLKIAKTEIEKCVQQSLQLFIQELKSKV